MYSEDSLNFPIFLIAKNETLVHNMYGRTPIVPYMY